MLRPVAASAGLAQINAIGNLAGCGGTYLIGAIRHATRSYILAVVPLTVVQAIGRVALVSIAASLTSGSPFRQSRPLCSGARSRRCPSRVSRTGSRPHRRRVRRAGWR
jgi:hypothetical protein